jgi:hypothetical protein
MATSLFEFDGKISIVTGNACNTKHGHSPAYKEKIRYL